MGQDDRAEPGLSGEPGNQPAPPAGTPNDADFGRRRWQSLAFLAVVLLHLVPIWSVRYPPSCDGPAHLESAHALLNRASDQHTVDREHLALRRDPSVSWFPAVTLASLMLFASPQVALKLFMSGYVVLFPYALRYAATALDRRSGWLAFLGLPLVYNTLFLYGFYSFLYSLSVLLLTVGYWLRVRDVGLEQTWRLTGLALALQLTHVFSLVGAAVTLAALGAAQALARRRQGDLEVARALAGRIVAPLFAFLPALTLAVVFLLPRFEVRPVERASTAGRLRALPLASYGDGREVFLAGCLVALVATVGLMVAVRGVRQRRFVEADGLLVVALFWLGLWLAAPERMAHGSFLAERGALCLVVTLVLWCASRPLAGLAPAVGATLACVVALGVLGLHTSRARGVSRLLEEYVAAASNVPPGSVLLPLGTAGPVPPARVPFLEHAASYVAVARNGINLGNYQFAADHFPLTFRSRRGLGRWAGQDPKSLTEEDLARGLEAGGPVDVVLLWIPENPAPGIPAVASLKGLPAWEPHGSLVILGRHDAAARLPPPRRMKTSAGGEPLHGRVARRRAERPPRPFAPDGPGSSGRSARTTVSGALWGS